MGWKRTLNSIAAEQRSEREALRYQRELARAQLNYEKMQALEQAVHQVKVYENHVEVLRSVHKDCGEKWDWESLRNSDPPVQPTKSNTNEKLNKKRFLSYKPSFMDKLLNRVEQKRSEFRNAIKDGNLKDEKEYQEALTEFKNNYEEWELIRELAIKILSNDIEAFTEAIRQINPFSEIGELGSSLGFNCETSKLVEATLFVRSEEVIPDKSVSLLKSGKISIKPLAKTNFYALYQDYICGGVLRVARELFALLPIEITIVTAVSDIHNTKTGHKEEKPILSIVITRKTLEQLNFDELDPSDAMENFVHNMKFLSTKGFQPVEKILPSDIG